MSAVVFSAWYPSFHGLYLIFSIVFGRLCFFTDTDTEAESKLLFGASTVVICTVNSEGAFGIIADL